MTDVTIRPLVAADRHSWLPLWQAYLVFYKRELPDSVTESTFSRLIGNGAHSGLVAERDGKLVGFVNYLFHDSTWAVAQTCYLEDLFVSEAARGTGAGRKLIEGVYTVADAAQCTGVYWHTDDHNSTARRLYDRVGTLSKCVRYERPQPD